MKVTIMYYDNVLHFMLCVLFYINLIYINLIYIIKLLTKIVTAVSLIPNPV